MSSSTLNDGLFLRQRDWHSFSTLGRYPEKKRLESIYLLCVCLQGERKSSVLSGSPGMVLLGGTCPGGNVVEDRGEVGIVGFVALGEIEP
jgi:hypothetical protein